MRGATRHSATHTAFPRRRLIDGGADKECTMAIGSSTDQRHRQQSAVPGAHAERPSQIPARGWKQVAKRGWAEAKADQVPLLGAGVAFFAFLALFPAVI